MSDETTKVTAEEPEAPAEATAVNPIEEWFKTASPDEIMKNDRVRGILGSRLQTEREKIHRELGEEQERSARQKAESDLLKLAESDPYVFAQTYLSEAEQKRIAKETANLKAGARADFAKQLGAGYSALAEWTSLDASEREQLARSVAGKSDDDALVSFNAAALDVIAERRANAKMAKRWETDIAKEREAIRQEEAAKRLNGSARPSLVRGGAAPVGNGWQDLPAGSDFNKEYEKNVLRRGR